MISVRTTACFLFILLKPILVHSQDDNIFEFISLEEALLTDLVPDTDDPSSCSFEDDASTSWTFNFPGGNPNSKWYEGPCLDESTYPGAPCNNFSMYETQLFLAEMSHTDPTHSHRNWTMRIGQGSNIYSFYSPELYGEAIPPQYHNAGPWIDEVQQSVAVEQRQLREGPPYFIHQAGCYQKDPEYTGSPQLAGDPFFSPNVRVSGQVLQGQHMYIRELGPAGACANRIRLEAVVCQSLSQLRQWNSRGDANIPKLCQGR